MSPFRGCLGEGRVCEGFQALLDSFVDGVLVYDGDERIVRVNRAAADLFRATPEEIIGTGVWELIRCNTHDPLLTDPLFVPVVNANPSWRFDCFASCFDGVLRPLSLTINRLFGTTELVCMVVRDVSKWVELFRSIREQEESFHSLFDEFPGAVVILSLPDLRVTLVNRRALELFRYEKGVLDGVRQPFFSHEEFREIVDGDGKSGPSGISRRLRGNRSDGSTFHASVDIDRLMLRGEELLSCSIKDISEEVRIEEESRSIQARLIHANKMTSLGLLVAGIAHEVNNPNSYILANAQVLKDILGTIGDFRCLEDGTTPSQTTYLRMIQSLPEIVDGIIDGSRRISSVVSELKNYAGRERDLPIPHDMNQIVQKVLVFVRHEINRYTDRFELMLTDDPVMVRCSPQQIEQLLVNLILNALHSLESRDRRVVVKTELRGDTGVVIVADDGHGIPPDCIDRICEPFFTTRLDQGGTGLGLYICRSIVEHHQGQMHIESEVGKGTAVTVSFPLHRAEREGERIR